MEMLANTMVVIIIAIYKCIELTDCIPSTYTMLHVNYVSMKLEKKEKLCLRGRK